MKNALFEIIKNCIDFSILAYEEKEREKNIGEILKKRNMEVKIFHLGNKMDWMIIEDRQNKIVYFAFAGTELEELKDILADLNFDFNKVLFENKKMKIHDGFYRYWKRNGKLLLKKTKEYINDGWKIVNCGHSLGGALAVVNTFFSTEYLKRKNCKRELLCITFGQPRVGSKKFAELCNEKFIHYRFYINTDIVPKLPPKFLGFEHSGIPLEIDNRQYVWEIDYLKHHGWRYALSVVLYIMNIWLISYIFYIVDIIINGIKSHSMKTYKRKLLEENWLEDLLK